MGNFITRKKGASKPVTISPIIASGKYSNIKPILRQQNSLIQPSKPLVPSVTFIDEKIMSENKFEQPIQKQIEKIISPFYVDNSPKVKRRFRSLSNPSSLDQYFIKSQYRRRKGSTMPPFQRKHRYSPSLSNFDDVQLTFANIYDNLSQNQPVATMSQINTAK